MQELKWTRPAWVQPGHLCAEGSNESCYDLHEDGGKFHLWWRTRTGSSYLGAYATLEEAQVAAQNHHNPK